MYSQEKNLHKKNFQLNSTREMIRSDILIISVIFFLTSMFLLERERDHISSLALNLSHQMDYNNSLLEQVRSITQMKCFF